jgi:hypothetical protein
MTYAIALPDGNTKTYERLSAATERAQKLAVAQGIELEVIHTETGSLVFAATPVQGRRFHPFERVETPRFTAPALEGYRLAYTRKRIESGVYRALDHSHWLVYDGRTGAKREVANTKEACALTKAMKDVPLA